MPSSEDSTLETTTSRPEPKPRHPGGEGEDHKDKVPGKHSDDD
jgi:hypothetical protein